MKKIVLLLFVILLQFSCSEKKDKDNPFIKKEIIQTDNALNKTLEEQEEIKQQIIVLSRKKDSLINVLKSTKESVSRINETKIDKGIAGVNIKLNELKGQKENFQEQVDLQKKEVDLANKKVDLLSQEKIVYDAQRKALYDKGAPPKDFVKVDSLLGGINSKINEQKKKVKSLNRMVADVEEQVLSINDQRDFLSKKIRENYGAQEIFSEFAKEEDSKITEQIKKIDLQISALSGDVSNINNTIASLNDTISVKQAEHQENALLQTESTKTKNRLYIALGAIAIILLVFAGLYFVGKKKKNNANNIK